MVSVKIQKRDTVVAPYVAQTTGQFEGDDGQWSTFLISVGTPPQSFRVLPATIDSVTTVPFPQGCSGILVNVDNCGDLRGIDTFQNTVSRGFSSDASSTYNQLGIFNLFQGQTTYTNQSAMYFRDTLTLPTSDKSRNITVRRQVSAGFSSTDFWLGTIGVGNTTMNYTSASYTAASLLYQMKNQSLIPSVSFGYTAGRYYDQRLGSLTLGGYDANRQTDSTITTDVDQSTAWKQLKLGVQNMFVKNGTIENIQITPFTADIDSSFNQLWLPEAVCDKIASRFGLTFDTTRLVYTIDDATHQIQLKANPTITFQIGGSESGGTTNINLAYNAFNQSAGIPLFNDSTPYFPLRRATDPSQYVLGRTFLQEAYLVVDWEQNKFTIGPVNYANSASSIQAITPPSLSSSTSPSASAPTSTAQPSTSSGGISAGAIAGIVIAVLAIAAIAAFFFFRRNRRRPAHQRWSMFSMRKSVEPPPPAYEQGPEFYNDKPETTESKDPQNTISEMYDSSKPRAELTSDNIRRLEELAEQRELMSTPVAELVGDHTHSELDVMSNPARESLASGSNTARNSVALPQRKSTLGPQRAKSPLSGSEFFELE